MPFNWDDMNDHNQQPGIGSRFDVEKYLGKYNRKIKTIKPHEDSTMYVLEECVFDPGHNGGEAAIIQKAGGKLLYQCFHDSCKDKKWRDAKQIISGIDKIEGFVSKIEKCAKYDIESFLDNPDATLEEYNQNYVRIPFAGRNLKNFESLMNGGFIGGRPYIFGGIPSAGKTVLLNNIADNICLNGYPVLFFSYDDGKSELRYRTLARFSEYGIEYFNNQRVPDFKKVLNNTEIKQIMPLKYVVQNNIKVEDWSDLVEKVIQKHEKPPVLIVDYLKKLKTKSIMREERLRVDDIIGKITDLAKEYNVPVLVISELARDSYKSGQRLSMASFKESGSIEYEASWLGILAAVEEKDGEYVLKENWENIIEHDGNIDLIIFKAKRGTGNTGRVPLKVDRTRMTVSDRTDEKISLSNIKRSTKY